MTKLGGAKALLDFVKRADLNFAEGAATVRQLPAARDSQRSCRPLLPRSSHPLSSPTPPSFCAPPRAAAGGPGPRPIRPRPRSDSHARASGGHGAAGHVGGLRQGDVQEPAPRRLRGQRRRPAASALPQVLRRLVRCSPRLPPPCARRSSAAVRAEPSLLSPFSLPVRPPAQGPHPGRGGQPGRLFVGGAGPHSDALHPSVQPLRPHVRPAAPLLSAPSGRKAARASPAPARTGWGRWRWRRRWPRSARRRSARSL